MVDWQKKLEQTMTLHGLKFVAKLIQQEIKSGNENVIAQRDKLATTYVRRIQEVTAIWQK